MSTQIDITALRAYRNALGRRTREIAACLQLEQLAEAVPVARVRRAVAEGVLGSERANWVEPLWVGKTKAWFLWPGTGHNYWHLGEMFCIRSQLGKTLE